MSLRKALEKLKYDTRMVQINEKNGTMPKQELDSHKSQLQDEADKAMAINLEPNQSSEQNQQCRQLPAVTSTKIHLR